MKNKYRIGELAEYFNVSRDTLRHYDKIGILKPEKNSENSYRVYSREDFIFLTYVMDLRKMGFSLEDIKVLTNKGSIPTAEAMMQVQSKLIENKITELKKIQSRLGDYSTSFRNVIRETDKIQVKTSPVMICKKVGGQGRSLIDALDSFNAINNNAVPRFTFISKMEDYLDEGFANKITESGSRKDVFANALTLIDDENLAQRIDLKERGLTVIPSHKCIFAIGKTYTDKDYDGITNIVKWIKKEKMNACGDMLSRIVSIRKRSDESIVHYEIWVPII